MGVKTVDEKSDKVKTPLVSSGGSRLKINMSSKKATDTPVISATDLSHTTPSPEDVQLISSPEEDDSSALFSAPKSI